MCHFIINRVNTGGWHNSIASGGVFRSERVTIIIRKRVRNGMTAVVVVLAKKKKK